MAEKSKRTCSPIVAIETVDSVRVGDLAWHSAARNAEKSCVPTSAPAASVIAATSSDRWYQPARPARSAGRTARQREQVRVVAADGGVTRMEFVGHRPRPEHRDGRRKIRIDAAHPRGVRARCRDFEMDDLHRRVHAGVGAARRNRADGGVRDHGKRALEGVLHAAAVRLRLPAGEGRAAVFESEGDAHVQARHQSAPSARTSHGAADRVELI